MARIKLTVVGLYNYNQELFDRMSLPDGINKDYLVQNILERAGDMPLLYPNYDFMESMIGVWAHNEQDIWARLHATTTLEYNPIENYNRHEDITRDVSGTGESTGISAQTAFNSDSFKDTGKSTGSSSNSGNEKVNAHMYGNIGVTTSQEMIEQEREVAKFCIYDYITQSFIDRFCIEIY